MCISALLSQYKGKSRGIDMCKAWSNPSTQTSSLVVFDILLYSASTDDLETVIYFLIFHETKECPRKTQKEVISIGEEVG